MSNDTKHSVILTLVNKGGGEEVVRTARNAGAKGGIIIDAQYIDNFEFSEVTVRTEIEIALIFAEINNCQSIMNAVNEALRLQSPAHGIILSVSINEIAGVDM